MRDLFEFLASEEDKTISGYAFTNFFYYTNIMKSFAALGVAIALSKDFQIVSIWLLHVFIRISREIRINMHIHFYTFQKIYSQYQIVKAIPNVSYYEKNNPLRVVTADSPEIKILLEAVINLVKANTQILVDIWVSS